MFYEGCTIDEIRAYRDLESEVFDFGEGEMRIEGWYGSEDAYYEMCLPEESGWDEYYYEHFYHKYKPKPKLKYKASRYCKKQKYKQRLEKLCHIRWWAVTDMNTHKRRCYMSGRRKYARKQSNKKVRNYKSGISNGGNYRKVYDFWWEVL